MPVQMVAQTRPILRLEERVTLVLGRVILAILWAGEVVSRTLDLLQLFLDRAISRLLIVPTTGNQVLVIIIIAIQVYH